MGLEEVQKVRTRAEEYDSLVGSFTRVVKPNSILHLASAGSTQPGSAGDFTLASTTLDADNEAWIHSLEFGADAAATFVVVLDTSTILPRRIAAAGATQPIFAPHMLERVAPGTTISLIATSASTGTSYEGWLSARKVPIAAKLETE